MDWPTELSQEAEGLDFQSLSRLQSDEKVCAAIDHTRPLTDYATAHQIAMFLQMRDKAVHVYTKDLQKGGKAVQDSMDKYLAEKDYYSSSSLKAALKSPLHLFYQKDSGWKDDLEKLQGEKSHFVIGTYLHECLLEPTKFKRVIVEPKLPLSSLDGVRGLIKFWKDVINDLGEVEHEGNTIDAETAFTTAKIAVKEMGFDIHKHAGMKAHYRMLKQISMMQAVSEEHKLQIDCVYHNYKRYGNGILFEIMKRSKREISLYYTDPVTGIKVRIRPDAMQFEENLGFNTIISVKSTRAESLSHFAYESAKHVYELSEAMYLEVASGVTGRDFNSVITIMLQNQPPYGVAVMIWNGEDIEIGKYKYRQALQTALECKEKGKYPGYDAMAESGNLGLIDFKQPSWNSKELYPVDIDN